MGSIYIESFLFCLFVEVKKWWEEQDSNLRSPKATDLQSVAFDRSAIFPYSHLLFMKTILVYIK